MHIPDNHKLFSLDVVSLYTNIPTVLVPQILHEKWSLIEPYTSIPESEFIEAVQLTLGTCYFKFEENFFQQIDGVSMGSPISSTVAQLVMEYLEEKVLSGQNYNITLFKRYVDDCLIITSENEIQRIIDGLNSFHHKIQFTLETEMNNAINFLDMTLLRINNSVQTKLYRKETCTDRIIDYNSAHIYKQKKAIMIGYIDRALKLTSPIYRPTIIQDITSLLIKNNYPLPQIKKIIKQRTHKLYNTENSTNKKEEPITFIPIPYVPSLSEKIENILKPYSNVKIAHKPHIQIKQLYSKLKSPTPLTETSHVVYKINCNNCEGVYIGQTEQKLKDRLKGHKYSKTQTALYKHKTENGHTFNYDETVVLDRETNKKSREFLEMIHIKQNEKSINDRSDIKYLHNIYSTILNSLK